ncbi:MAG: hypothetical protein ACI3XQ_12360 [Eubacteriales bacterium]
MSISENPVACKVKKFCKALSELQLEKDYDITLSLYPDENTESPSCSHHFKGSSKHGLVKAILTVGAIGMIMSSVCALCSCIRS